MKIGLVMKYNKLLSVILLLICTNLLFAYAGRKPDKPNVIIVITDDQGYGDLACHGNPVIKTPRLDKFHDEAVRLTDFHVGPTCAPTRSGLMTGRYCNRTGVWHTIGGCSILRENEVTLAEVFSQNGYETAMFGKWHLGDAYPSRPHDKGFDHSVYHGGGGVGQTPDYWGNDYFDDTYFVNGEPERFSGYCTDVWYQEAIRFIRRQKDNPFLCYISTNAPHSPFNVPLEYYDQYMDENIPEFQKRFYGMISNADHNFGLLREELKKLKIENNTILIFMTDNGTAAGYRTVGETVYGFNAGMRGTKGSEYEGGHRVPFFIRYPGGSIGGGRDVSMLTAHIDVLPTLAALCDLDLPDLALDGRDISAVLTGRSSSVQRDYIITDSQRLQEPVKWRKSSVMKDKWRLINGKELYFITSDPGQESDLAGKYPERVREMRGYYNEWWSSVSSEFNLYPVIKVGSKYENPVIITCHDSHIEDSKIPWNQNFIRQGLKNPEGGSYVIEFASDGEYRIAISRWPFESGLAINEGTEDGYDAEVNFEGVPDGKALNFISGGVKIGAWKEEKSIEPDAEKLLFTGNFSKGKSIMTAWFTTAGKKDWGAYYISIEKID
jgi:arylsulfatase A-like enzyme